MNKIEITLEEARVILELREAHVRNLFREDYSEVMSEPLAAALEKLKLEDSEENRERLINYASIYFDLLKIN